MILMRGHMEWFMRPIMVMAIRITQLIPGLLALPWLIKLIVLQTL